MLKREVFKYYNQYAEDLERLYNYIKTTFIENSVEELANIRGYVDGCQVDLFREMNIGLSQGVDISILGESGRELGLVSNKDYFLLDGRFIVPIRAITGDLISLVGYYPDFKKYITIPSPFFHKETLFFNIDHAIKLSWDKFDGLVFLVEGIFDCLSLRALGLPVISTMGVTVKPPKSEQLKLFSKVIAITDNDKAGLRAMNRHDKRHGWQVPRNATFIKLVGVLETPHGVLKVKDADNLVSYFDEEVVRSVLLSFRDSTKEVETLYL